MVGRRCAGVPRRGGRLRGLGRRRTRGSRARSPTPRRCAASSSQDFADYYRSAPAQDFAARVFTNNALVAAQAILYGALLGLPIPYVLLQNALNVGVSGGLMVANGRGALFFGLVLPHGLLELTAVFVASGLGLKLGWTVVDPGRRTRTAALAQEGRALVAGALGLALVLLVSGVVEAFVTPSGLPTAVRVGIGALLEAAFLAYVLVLGGAGAPRRGDRRRHRRAGRRRAADRLTQRQPCGSTPPGTGCAGSYGVRVNTNVSSTMRPGVRVIRSPVK